MTTVRLLTPDDVELLCGAAPGVFDDDVDASLAAEFLADPRHHIAVALDGGVVVAMATALHYVHPDKPPELWIDEVGVADSHRSRGLGTRVLQALFEHGRTLGCTMAWVAADESNHAAHRLYRRAGGRATAEAAVIFEFRLDR